MPTYLAQIAPQRSTQYAELATDLAPQELFLSPAGEHLTRMEIIELGGQEYLQFDLEIEINADLIREVNMLAMTGMLFAYYDRIGEVSGPLLRPIEPLFTPVFPPEMVEARRYRGKTNEMFTHFLCNLARFSSAHAHKSWDKLRLFDPLAGGGTTLLTALMLGAEVSGIEKDEKAVETTVSFIKQFTREARIPSRHRDDKLKNVGRRWWFELGPASTRCVIARGETAQAPDFMYGLKKPHLIVTDLPYGIQHQGDLNDLLRGGLPAWGAVLDEGGVLAFAWESTRFPRDQMIALVENTGPFAVLNDPPYDQLAHQVDRVIKQRDVIVAGRV